MTETTEQRRERLARIIAPVIWDLFDAWCEAKEVTESERRDRISTSPSLRTSLTVADAIIASDEAAGVVCVPAEMVKAARDRVGPWLSAALDNPDVCAEMKADINALFDAMPMPDAGRE